MENESENFIKLVNQLQDKLLPVGIDLGLDLPQIAVIGGQSAGKSSVLESFVGRDFLPRGNNIVTRRPLVLQLINNRDSSKSYGEFLHIPGKKFYDFKEIRDEITNETDKEVKDNYGISSKAINLKIYSPDVLDLTLVDLPGMTRVPVGNQPRDIEQRILNMIMEYIERDNCLILAVTAANQDLATSDALKMAEKVDPKGKRTIGVLTKLDLMDKGTDARAILTGKHLPLRMGYIGVVNRSQKDIDDNKDMEKALADEKAYFRSHNSYKDISEKLGVIYLQKFLNKELTKHIMRILPLLKQKFQTEFNELNEELERLQNPIQDSDNDLILSKTNEEFKKNYDSSIGGFGIKIDIKKLSGGAKINVIMNDKFAKEVNQMVYDENRMKCEITTAIQNFFGIYLGVFTPDAAFKAVTENQIERFRKPSIDCVEWVSQELENIIKESADKIQRFSSLKQLYAKLTLDYLRECKKRCKEKVSHFVEAEKTYLNTIHEDFLGFTSIENSAPISDAQLKVSADVLDKINHKNESNESQLMSGWISYKKTEFWFVLSLQTLTWYKDDKMREKKSSVSILGAKFEERDYLKGDTIILVLNKKAIFSIKNETIELNFDSEEDADKWREKLKESGIQSTKDSTFTLSKRDSNTSQTQSMTNMSIYDSNTQLNGLNEEMACPEYMNGPVDQVKKLVDSYVVIMKKKFKDYIPKICIIEMVDSTRDFLAVVLRLKVRDSINSIDDIVKGDPDEELRRDLTKKTSYYSEVIDIMAKFTQFEDSAEEESL